MRLCSRNTDLNGTQLGVIEFYQKFSVLLPKKEEIPINELNARSMTNTASPQWQRQR